MLGYIENNWLFLDITPYLLYRIENLMKNFLVICTLILFVSIIFNPLHLVRFFCRIIIYVLQSIIYIFSRIFKNIRPKLARVDEVLSKAGIKIENSIDSMIHRNKKGKFRKKRHAFNKFFFWILLLIVLYYAMK